MLVLDVNVVLAVHRGDHPHHEPLRRWFDEMIGLGDQFSVPSLVWASFLRIATNRRVFSVPTPRAEAFAFVDAVCAQPQHVLTSPGPRHLALLARVCAEGEAVGDLVPDAVLAAVATEYGAEVVTLDRDFARFPSVRHRLLTT